MMSESLWVYELAMGMESLGFPRDNQVHGREKLRNKVGKTVSAPTVSQPTHLCLATPYQRIASNTKSFTDFVCTLRDHAE